MSDILKIDPEDDGDISLILGSEYSSFLNCPYSVIDVIMVNNVKYFMTDSL